MLIPADQAIKTTMRPGTVYYFIEDTFVSNDPHYFVLLNKVPKVTEPVVLVAATSQIAKREAWVQKIGLPNETLLLADSSTCSFLQHPSVFDCNSPIIHPTGQIIVSKYTLQELRLIDTVSMDVYNALVLGVLNSPMVQEEIKELLR